MPGKPPWFRKGFRKKFKEPKEKPTTPEEKTTTEEKQNLKGGGIASGMRRFNRGGKV